MRVDGRRNVPRLVRCGSRTQVGMDVQSSTAAAMLTVTLREFRKVEEVMKDTAKVSSKVTVEKGRNATLGKAVKAVWGMINAEDAGVYCLSITGNPREDGVSSYRTCGRAGWTAGGITHDDGHVRACKTDGGMRARSRSTTPGWCSFSEAETYVYRGMSEKRYSRTRASPMTSTTSSPQGTTRPS